ncbi:imidazolonepropionase [Paratrimastix pyriformis]|uniref:Probable imidazolonepropionase n=1 Tax=Paratrimastix pyriformis TaxID=342808 RepID=A0ABQ8UUS8_9EUKA|nr:imidazolonepropionase [Paratrimastix pyriformis]
MHFRLRIRDADQIVRVACHNERNKRTQEEMNDLCILEHGTIIVGDDGKIAFVGTEAEASTDPRFAGATFDRDLNGHGLSIVPGLVDAHTHPIWAGDRVNEFAMKLAGATYMDIHKAGGGIGFTVEHTRRASPEELKTLLEARLSRMLRAGTTLAETKSGYGLDLETEVKLLKVLHEVSKTHPIGMVTTYLGAHSVPKGTTADAHTRDIVERHLPELKRLEAQGELHVDNVDLFLERGIFELGHAREILVAAQQRGYALNFHGDEMHDMHGAQLAAELKALAISHLESASPEGIEAMGQAGTHAVLLPTCPYVLKKSNLPYPNARAMIAAHVPIVVASDYNPNAHCLAMPVVMNLACIQMGLTMPEVLVASTLNAAASLGRADRYGSLEVGKEGDLVVVGASRWEHLVYELGDPPVAGVYKAGRCVA